MPTEKLVVILPIVIIGFVLALIMIATLIIARTRRQQRYNAYAVPTEDRNRISRGGNHHHRHSHQPRGSDRRSHQYDQVPNNNTTEEYNSLSQTVNIPPPAYNEHRGDVRLLMPVAV